MSKVVELRSGGQSGADRGAMDAAISMGIPVSGWCPKGGWAEDLTEPPGLMALYPTMRETKTKDTRERTELNVRDSTCCVFLNTKHRAVSPGTDAAYAFLAKYDKPAFEIVLDDREPVEDQVLSCAEWIASLNLGEIVLGVGGPRASEYPGIYDLSYSLTRLLIQHIS